MEEEEERPVRLQPLASSAMPSIKEMLAMSEEMEKAEKRKARKEKRKGGGGGGGPSEKDTKAKLDRDYQRCVCSWLSALWSSVANSCAG